MIKGEKRFVLLDEQQVVYGAVFAKARESYHQKKKVVILVNGGPGTGKSLIAVNLIGDLSLNGYNARYATGSKAFTRNLQQAVGSGQVYSSDSLRATAEQNTMQWMF